MRTMLVVTLLASLVLAGCTTNEPIRRDQLGFGVVTTVSGVDGLRVNLTDGNATVGLGPLVQATNGTLQACIESCGDLGLGSGLVVAEGSVVSFNNLSLNYDGPDGNSFVFFHDRGQFNSQYLAWADGPGQFELSAGLVAGGNLTATGHVGTTTVFVEGQNVIPVRSAAMEGIEVAVFIRGSATLVNGTANITLPQTFSVLVGQGLMTVQATLTSKGAPIYVAQKTPFNIRIETVDGSPSNATFDFFVQAPRAGQESFTAV